jgi:ABC-type sugar transport system substrate-binding protein
VKIRPAAIVAVSAVLLAGGDVAAQRMPEQTPDGSAVPARIGVVLKGLDNSFFLAMYAGVRAESAALGVRTAVRSVTGDTDLAGERAQVRALAAQRQDCYVANPITATNLVPALRDVPGPIVNVDSPVDPAAARRAHVRIRSYIGTDDVAAGRLAGTTMAALLRRGGGVALLAGLPSSANSGFRLRGFEQGIAGSRVRVVERVTADYDRTKAEVAAGQILRRHPRIAGFFAVNDLMALGVADAVRAADRAGQVKVIGLDGIAEALDAVRDGSLAATVSQYPYVMGRMAVEACAAAAGGAQLPARVDAPIALISRDNVARAIAAFPRPVGRYADPFRRLVPTSVRLTRPEVGG